MYKLFEVISAIWLIGWIGLGVMVAIAQRDSSVFYIVLPGLFGTGLLGVITKELRFRKLTKEIRSEPSSDNIKEYIRVTKKMKGISEPPSFWSGIIKTYMAAITPDHIDFDLKVELFETLKMIGTRGIPYPRQSNQVINQNREERIKEAGEEGERQVAHALDWLDKSRFKVYSDIRLPYQGRSQQFDTVIVGDKAVFNIETKNLSGDLTIDQEGNWYRVNGETKTGTDNVNFQVKRHNKVLSGVLEDKVPIVDLIVWANIASVLEGTENSPTKIIKVDQLVDYIEEYNEGRSLSPEEISLAKRLIEENIKRT